MLGVGPLLLVGLLATGKVEVPLVGGVAVGDVAMGEKIEVAISVMSSKTLLKASSNCVASSLS